MPMAFESNGGGRAGEARPVSPRRASSSRPAGAVSSFEPRDRATVEVETGTRPAQIVSFLSRWLTAGDERTCPVCAPLHGLIFRNDEGPHPPLHRSCRCRRAHAGVEVETRE